MSVDGKTNEGLTLHLVEALRGLQGAQYRIVTAIEELNAPKPEGIHAHDETALRLTAEALEHNVDFIKYAKQTCDLLAARIQETRI
jgi:hypothetical protein